MNQLNPLFDTYLERIVLGTLLNEPASIARIGSLFKPELFFSQEHEIAAKAIFKLFKAQLPIDALTAWNEIKKQGNDSVVTFGEVLAYGNDVVSSAHLENHTLKLTELYMARECQKIGGRLYGRGGDVTEDIFDIMSEAQKELSDLAAGTMQGGLIHISDTLHTTLMAISKMEHGAITGIGTGLECLDQVFHGFKPHELIILAARPGCGKTALALQVRREAAKQGKKTAFFSLEMGTSQLHQRDLAAESGVKFARIQRNQMELHEHKLLNEAVERLSKLPMYTDDSFNSNVQILVSKCVQMKYRHGLDAVFVDYLQLIGGKTGAGKNREQVIAEISRGLKGLAKQLEVPVIALSQMSRDVEKNGRTEPVLSDLRESGALEQDADAVIFLTPDSQEENEMGQPKVIRAKIAKHRNGPCDTKELIFDGNYMRFTDNKPF